MLTHHYMVENVGVVEYMDEHMDKNVDEDPSEAFLCGTQSGTGDSC